MIKYEIDETNKFGAVIIKTLENYNLTYAPSFNKENIYIYVYFQEQLVGFATVVFVWDWIFPTKLLYQNKSVLALIIQSAWDQFSTNSLGIRYFTQVQERVNDFLSLGFNSCGMLKDPHRWCVAMEELSNAVKIALKDREILNYTVIVSNIEKEQEVKLVQENLANFRVKYHLEEEKKRDTLRMVALDNEQFIGGVICDIFNNRMTINEVVVVEEYRHQGIGSTLMQWAEEQASARNLTDVYLNTADFNARPFYERRGFRVIHTMTNYPKGYNSYRMQKHLE